MVVDNQQDLRVRVKISDFPNFTNYFYLHHNPLTARDLEGLDTQVKKALAAYSKGILKDIKDKVFTFTFKRHYGYTEVDVIDGKFRKFTIHVYNIQLENASCDCEDFTREGASLCEHLVALDYYLHKGDQDQVWKKIVQSCHHKLKSTDPRPTLRHYCSLHDKVQTVGTFEDRVIESPSYRVYAKLPRSASLIPASISDTECDNLLTGINLYSYQKEILRALASATCGICAMDVGTGKTLTTIALMEWVRRHTVPDLKVLAIVPKSLMLQWESEIIRTTHFPVTIVKKLDDLKKFTQMTSNGVAILTYQFAQRNVESIFGMTPVDMVVFDEIQYIRNNSSKTWKALKELVVGIWNVPRKIALSGTVIENEVDDLYSALQIIDDQVLPAKWKFDALYKEELKTGSNGITILYHGTRNVEVLQKKIAHRVFGYDARDCDLSLHPHWMPITLDPSEKKRQDYFEAKAKELQAKVMSMDYPPKKLRLIIQSYLLKARQACNSELLVDGKGAKKASSKISKICDVILDLARNQNKKIVLFSEWVEMLKLIAENLQPEFDKQGWNYVLYIGSKSIQQRHEAVMKFQNDPNTRLFLSSDAGGVGLDGLQRAAHVVMHSELPWNPSRLDQRNGRVHRNLQTHDVEAYYFYASNGIEERIRQVLERKRNIRNSVMKDLKIEDVI